MCGPRHRSTHAPCRYSVITWSAPRSRISSALYASPRASKNAVASPRSHTSRVERRVGRDDLAHPGLDRREVLRRERDVAGEIVVEPVLDRRPDRHLRARVEPLHRFRQHVRRVVADQLQRLRVAPCHEAHRRVVLDRPRQVEQRAVDAHGQRRLGQPRPDRGRQRGPGHRGLEAADGAVGQGDRGHGTGSLERHVARILPARHGRGDIGPQAGEAPDPGRRGGPGGCRPGTIRSCQAGRQESSFSEEKEAKRLCMKVAESPTGMKPS